MLSSYDTFRRDFDLINTIDWACIVFDEVHKVKGMNTLDALFVVLTLCRSQSKDHSGLQEATHAEEIRLDGHCNAEQF